MNRVLLLLVIIAFCGLLGVNGCGRRRRRCPPRDYTPPVITCPSNINRINDPFQINAKVTYAKPKAYDNGKEISARLTRGLPSGYIFREGTTWVRYTARDGSGNSASCQFSINVRVVRCPMYTRQTDGWKICHVSTDMRYGSYCRFGCYPGHELIGTPYTRCQSSGQWTVPNQPYCRKRTCDALFPTADQVNRVNITCSDNYNYRSICTYRCGDGYSVSPGHSKVRVCGATGNWVGTTPSCVDTSPPEFTNCPVVITAYAERNKTSGRVFWDDPMAIDNSDSVTIEQPLWPQSGMDLDVGEYDITHTATDSNGNTATCEFKVIVKQITCPSIYPLPYTSVTCPTGRILGSTCQFACDNGTSTSQPLETQCDRHGSTHYYGGWDFGNDQPYCQRTNNCTDLRAPDNGALACDTWLYGRYCQMLCQDGFAVQDSEDYNVHKGLLVCGDSGVWRISDQIPNCVEVYRGRSIVDVSVSYRYYEGPCEEAIDDIKIKFLVSFTTLLPCDEPDCHVDNVEVICGTSSSVKRDTSSKIDVKATLAISEDKSYKETVAITQAVKNNLKDAQASGALNIAINGQNLTADAIDVSQATADCPDGTVPGTALKCVKCGVGSYQDNTVCKQCEIGRYQDETGQTSCKQCPSGMTTEQKGATVCKEACGLGHYSEKGTTPCDPCDIGYYADVQGTRGQCSPCPGSKTTNKTGSTSASVCYDFDLDFFALSEEEEPELASVLASIPSTQQELSFNMWVNCTVCDHILTITNNVDNSNVITIHGGDTITTKVGSITESSESVTFDRWRYLYIYYVAISPSSLQVYLDGQQVITMSLTASTLPPVLNVTLGGPSFKGKISQFNMHSTHSASRRRRSSSLASTCFTDNVGDILKWTHFTSLGGSFVQTRSKCDAHDNCGSSPCMNGGRCSDEIDDFICKCVDGFTGKTCSINIDDCVDDPCDNNGTCVDDVDGFTCSCPTGFSGQLCEIKVVAGDWSSYGNWTLCSVTCGVGQQVRNRTCDNPEPSNGGAECVGASFEIQACTMEPCIYECDTDLDPIENGDLGCEDWIGEEETRNCTPVCNDGYAFDSDLHVDPPNVFCGPNSGNLWNVVTLNLPTCQPKTSANTNILNYTNGYKNLSPSGSIDPVLTDINGKVNINAWKTTCVTNKKCKIAKTFVELKEDDSSRRRRSTSYVSFTIQITCDITTDMNECYDLLTTFVNEFNDLINENAFTVNFDGGSYDITANSTSLDGISVCQDGYVPVSHYCVACGPGMYEGGEFCIQCPVGYYQDQTAQLACKQCPDGWTTADVQSRDVSKCNVANTSDSTDDTFNYAILAAAIALAVIIIVVMVIVGVIIKKKSKPERASSQVHVSEAQTRADYNGNRHFQTPVNLFTVSPPPYSPRGLAQSHGHASALPTKGAIEAFELHAPHMPTSENERNLTRIGVIQQPYGAVWPIQRHEAFMDTKGQASPLPRKKTGPV